MKRNTVPKNESLGVTVWMSLALAVLGIILFSGYGAKLVALAAGCSAILFLAKEDLKRLANLPSLFVLGFAAFSMLTALWAIAGKFFLREYIKVFVSACFFLIVVLRGKRKRGFIRRILLIISGAAAINTILSVEAASTGLTAALLRQFPSMMNVSFKMSVGRLHGIFNNANISAGLWGLGIFCALAVDETSIVERRFGLVCASVNIVAFTLAVSRGAMLSLGVATVLCFVFCARSRAWALLLMMEAAIPALLCTVPAFMFLTQGKFPYLALVMMLLAATASVMLDRFLGRKLSEWFVQKEKAVTCFAAGIVAFAVLYLVAGMLIGSAYTFGSYLMRYEAVTPGEHVLLIEADGDVIVRIRRQSEDEITTGERTTIYHQYIPAEGAVFVVPEDGAVCSFAFDADPGTTLYKATIDGKQNIRLGYPLLPEFIAARLQGSIYSTNMMQRYRFMEDGIKVFRKHLIIGSGVGAFETAVSSVQDFPYETKYIHNHYVQILAESGVIGFVLWIGTLAAMTTALWKGRKREYGGEYPALWGCLTMMAVHSAVEVTMSISNYIILIYAIFGLIVLDSGDTLALHLDSGAQRAHKQPQPTADPRLIRIACIMLPALFMLSVCLNLYANYLTHKEPRTFSDFDQAIKIDLYEHNDWKLSYVLGAQSEGTGEHIAQANKYAEQLSKVQSNTIPRHLTAYYLNTQQYEKAIDEAMLGATYSVSDPDTWNSTITLLKQTFIDSGYASPLLSEGEVLMPKLMEYHAMLERYNETALVPIALNESSRSFFDTVLALNECVGDVEATLAILMGAQAG